jgi:protein transport protein SEC61 subunit gamma-like protein
MADKQEPGFFKNKSNPIGYVVANTEEFYTDSKRLVRKCSKPTSKEYFRIVAACAIGFLIMGFIGFFVKLVFIPINNILLTSGTA